MQRNDLNDLEKRFIAFAVRHYRDRFYQYGYRVGWIGIPLLILSMLPSFRSDRIRLICALYSVAIAWLFIFVVRVVGRLADTNENGALHLEQGNVNTIPGQVSRTVMSLLTIAVICPLAGCIGFLMSLGTPKRSVLMGFFATEVVLCFLVSAAEILTAIIVYACGDHALSNRIFAFGIDMLCWIFLAILCCVWLGIGHVRHY